MALKPILYSIPAFDADFDTSSPPIFKFSWEGDVVYHNRVVIYDYNTNDLVYDCKVATMARQHQLHKTSDAPTEKITQANPYSLVNGHKYMAKLYVYTSDGVESFPSDWCIFYCFDTPKFEFTNFQTDDTNDIAIVTTSSINFTVVYHDKQSESAAFRNPLKSYHFELKDYHGTTLYASDTKYSSSTGDTLRYTIGGVDETKEDNFGNIVFDEAYTIVCKGETQHGTVLYTEQKFVVKLESTGVGSLIKVTNVGDGRVLISSNYKVMNAHCSVDYPSYLNDETGEPYAVDLSKGEYIEFTDGFNIQAPYEIIFKGAFYVGKLIALRTQNRTANESEKIIYDYGYIGLGKITYTTLPHYYFYLTIEQDGISHEIRSEYFKSPSDFVTAAIDLSYYNGLYNIKATVDYSDAVYISADNNKGYANIYFFTEHSITDSENGNIVLSNDKLLISDDDDGNVTISTKKKGDNLCL